MKANSQTKKMAKKVKRITSFKDVIGESFVSLFGDDIVMHEENLFTLFSLKSDEGAFLCVDLHSGKLYLYNGAQYFPVDYSEMPAFLKNGGKGAGKYKHINERNWKDLTDKAKAQEIFKYHYPDAVERLYPTDVTPPDFEAYYIKLYDGTSEKSVYLRSAQKNCWRVFFMRSYTGRLPLNTYSCSEYSLKEMLAGTDLRTKSGAYDCCDRLLSIDEVQYLSAFMPNEHAPKRPKGMACASDDAGTTEVTAYYWKGGKSVPCADENYILELFRSLEEIARCSVLLEFADEEEDISDIELFDREDGTEPALEEEKAPESEQAAQAEDTAAQAEQATEPEQAQQEPAEQAVWEEEALTPEETDAQSEQDSPAAQEDIAAQQEQPLEQPTPAPSKKGFFAKRKKNKKKLAAEAKGGEQPQPEVAAVQEPPEPVEKQEEVIITESFAQEPADTAYEEPVAEAEEVIFVEDSAQEPTAEMITEERESEPFVEVVAEALAAEEAVFEEAEPAAEAFAQVITEERESEAVEEISFEEPAEETGAAITEAREEEPLEAIVEEEPVQEALEETVEEALEEAPVEDTVKEAPVQEAPEEPAEEVPEEVPAEDAVKEEPVQEAPEEPAEEVPEEALVEDAVEEEPAQEAPEEPAEEALEEVPVEAVVEEEPIQEAAEETAADEAVYQSSEDAITRALIAEPTGEAEPAPPEQKSETEKRAELPKPVRIKKIKKQKGNTAEKRAVDLDLPQMISAYTASGKKKAIKKEMLKRLPNCPLIIPISAENLDNGKFVYISKQANALCGEKIIPFVLLADKFPLLPAQENEQKRKGVMVKSLVNKTKTYIPVFSDFKTAAQVFGTEEKLGVFTLKNVLTHIANNEDIYGITINPGSTNIKISKEELE
ncbi:MAG: hypothetical protein IJJ41_02515 [Clostridia bacterium]|nr:hypothetical protein [Clostridia bacterium]